MKHVGPITLFTLLGVGLAMPAQAYLDPGSGSMFLQLLLGGFAGLAVLIKMYWHKLKLMLAFKKPVAKEDMANENVSTADTSDSVAQR